MTSYNASALCLLTESDLSEYIFRVLENLQSNWIFISFFFTDVPSTVPKMTNYHSGAYEKHIFFTSN